MSVIQSLRRRARLYIHKLHWASIDARIKVLEPLVRQNKDTRSQTPETEEESARKKREEVIRDALHNRVGLIVSQWAVVETFLILLIGVLLETDREKAGLVMYSITNFSVWLSIISELLNADGDLGDHKKVWNKLESKLRKAKEVRDQVAHNTTFRHEDPQHFSEIDIKPALLDKRTKSLKQAPLTIEQLDDYSGTLMPISKDILVIMQEIYAIKQRRLDAARKTPTEQVR